MEIEIDYKRLSLHPRYPVWNAMVQRCTNPANRQYASYGGRGISVTPEWLPPKEKGFVQWLKDMVGTHERYFDSLGYLKKGLIGTPTFDRRGNNDNYTLENCRWVSTKVQGINRRGAKLGRKWPQGVQWRDNKQKFYAYAVPEGKSLYLGGFDTLFEAVCARKSWELSRVKNLELTDFQREN